MKWMKKKLTLTPYVPLTAPCWSTEQPYRERLIAIGDFFSTSLITISLTLQKWMKYLKAVLRNRFRYRRAHRRISERDQNGIHREDCVYLTLCMNDYRLNFSWKMWTFENLQRMLSCATDSIQESHVLAGLPASKSTVTTHQSGGFSPLWTVSIAEMDGWLIRK